MITIKDFIQSGVYQTKIIETNQPSVITWNTNKKKIVSGFDIYELITDVDGKQRLSIENNILISLLCYSELSDEIINNINESEDGIIITNHDNYFRFGLIPTKEYVEKNYIKIKTNEHVI